MKKHFFSGVAFLIIGAPSYLCAQGWQSLAPGTIYPVNATLSVSPVTIGIGTNTPSAQLHTTGSVRLQGVGTTALNTRILTVDNVGNVAWRDAGSWTGGLSGSFWTLTGNAVLPAHFIGTTNPEDLRIRTAGVQRAVFTTNGDLGIGIAAPMHRLSIQANEPIGDRRNFIFLRNDAATNNAAVGMQLSVGSLTSTGSLFHTSPTYTGISGFPSADMTILSTNGAGGIALASGSSTGRIIFATNAAGSFLERMRITETGNVGIATVTPTTRFHTVGTLRFEGLANNPAFSRVLVTDINGNVAWRSTDSLVPAPAPAWNLSGNAASSSDFLGTTNAENLHFRTGNTQKMVLGTNGNLLVGATSNPTNSRLYMETTANGDDRNMIHIHNNSTSSLSGAGMRMSSGTFTTFGSITHTATTYSGIAGFTASDMTLINTNGAGGIALASGSSTGDIIFATNAAGGSFAERMRLDQDGVLNIATSAFHSSHPAVPLVVDGDINVNGTIYSSDLRFKTNVNTLSGSLEKVKQLRGTSYTFRKDEFTDKNFSVSPQIGLIAQEVEKVFPELVKTDSKGYKGILYTNLIPVIIEAVKEQQSMIETLKEENRLIKAEIKTLRVTSVKAASEGNISSISGKAFLHQNAPNPFSEETSIEINIPAEMKEASLLIYDMQGTQLRKINIRERGNTKIVISGGELSAGMYLYTLIADGKEVDTKRMILTK
jgi:hypothetical protein